jgi:hypothetical protein
MTAFASLVDQTAFVAFAADGPVILGDDEVPVTLIGVVATVDGASAEHLTLSVARAYYHSDDEDAHAEWVDFDEEPLELVVPVGVVTSGYVVEESEEGEDDE